MYEYKCSNEACNEVWTIKEGGISTMYLTCPYCQKGRGQFLRHIVSDAIHEDIEKLAIRKPGDDFAQMPLPEEEKPEVIEKEAAEKKVKKPRTKTKEKSNIMEEQIKIEKEEKKPRKKEKIDVKVNVSEPGKEPAEDDIFERIIKKRQREEEILKNCEDNVDILEIAGDTEEEIEKRISEFEEYYYIKVLEKDIQQQGKRFHCIVKYCRR